jgi:hypothetical protein
MKYPKLKLNLRKNNYQKLLVVVVIVAVVLLGVRLLTMSHAESPYSSAYATAGVLSGGAALQSNPYASGSQDVEFGPGVTNIVPTLPAASSVNACSTVSLPSTLTTYNTSIPAVNSTPMPAIKAGSTTSGYSLVYTATGQPFVQRGADYVRLTTVDIGSKAVCLHSIFDTLGGQDLYNANESAAVLLAMHNLGYNTVHVGIDSSEIGLAGGYGLDPHYLANLASFINIARADQIRVLLVVGNLPTNGGYLPQRTSNVNNYFLYPAWISAEQRYLTDLISGLRSANANMSDILSFEIWSEQYFDPNTAPLNETSGEVLTAASSTPYNMSSQSQKDAMMDANLLNFENQLATTVHSDLPGGLASISFFSPSAEGPNRIVRPTSTFSSQSKIDFVNLHMYPVFGPLATQVASFGTTPTTINKPVVLGEFGAYEASDLTTSAEAATLLTSWQQQTCALTSMHITGWITWTWDTQPWEQTGYYNMTQDNNTIAKALSPTSRPNPCD